MPFSRRPPARALQRPSSRSRSPAPSLLVCVLTVVGTVADSNCFLHLPSTLRATSVLSNKISQKPSRNITEFLIIEYQLRNPILDKRPFSLGRGVWSGNCRNNQGSHKRGNRKQREFHGHGRRDGRTLGSFGRGRPRKGAIRVKCTLYCSSLVLVNRPDHERSEAAPAHRATNNPHERKRTRMRNTTLQPRLHKTSVYGCTRSSITQSLWWLVTFSYRNMDKGQYHCYICPESIVGHQSHPVQKFLAVGYKCYNSGNLHFGLPLPPSNDFSNISIWDAELHTVWFLGDIIKF